MLRKFKQLNQHFEKVNSVNKDRDAGVGHFFDPKGIAGSISEKFDGAATGHQEETERPGRKRLGSKCVRLDLRFKEGVSGEDFETENSRWPKWKALNPYMQGSSEK